MLDWWTMRTLGRPSFVVFWRENGPLLPENIHDIHVRDLHNEFSQYTRALWLLSVADVSALPYFFLIFFLSL